MEKKYLILGVVIIIIIIIIIISVQTKNAFDSRLNVNSMWPNVTGKMSNSDADVNTEWAIFSNLNTAKKYCKKDTNCKAIWETIQTSGGNPIYQLSKSTPGNPSSTQLQFSNNAVYVKK